MMNFQRSVTMDLYDFSATGLDGAPIAFDRYRGWTLLIVNVASACGYTPQYAELEALYRRHAARGFAVLGFPCNQFGEQEPGDADAIRDFCRASYDVTFPLFAKIDVNGPDAHPLWEWLKQAQPGVLGTSAIKWNFTKFLVSPAGEVLHRYAPITTPSQIEDDIVALLPKSR